MALSAAHVSSVNAASGHTSGVASTVTAAAPLLSIRGLVKRYGGLVVTSEVDMDLREGEIHALLGENGAGKSTLLKCLSGLQGFSGDVVFGGKSIRGAAPHAIVRSGLIQVPEARRIFGELTVRENL